MCFSTNVCLTGSTWTVILKTNGSLCHRKTHNNNRIPRMVPSSKRGREKVFGTCVVWSAKAECWKTYEEWQRPYLASRGSRWSVVFQSLIIPSLSCGSLCNGAETQDLPPTGLWDLFLKTGTGYEKRQHVVYMKTSPPSVASYGSRRRGDCHGPFLSFKKSMAFYVAH